MGKLIFVLGGARSGKSSFAQAYAEEHGKNVVYVATSEPVDQEIVERIEKHQDERPSEWQTIEVPFGLTEHFEKQPFQADTVILDCITMLVNNIAIKNMDDIDAPQEQLIFEQGMLEIENLLSYIEKSEATWLVVSNEVGLGLVPPYPLGRVYRDLLGAVNKKIALIADQVIFMIAGIPMHMETYRG